MTDKTEHLKDHSANVQPHLCLFELDIQCEKQQLFLMLTCVSGAQLLNLLFTRHQGRHLTGTVT